MCKGPMAEEIMEYWKDFESLKREVWLDHERDGGLE